MISELTAAERRIFNLLTDGKPHSVHEMRGCLDDPWIEASTIRVHICNLRRKLKKDGHMVIYERWGEKSCYRLARQVVS